MKSWIFSLAALLALATSHASPPRVASDPSRTTVSGISAGATMAHQLHVAYPDLFHGAGLVAPAPWGCAEGSLATALGRCMGGTDGSLHNDTLVASLRAAETRGDIGPLALLKDDRVWIFHGALDAVVAEPVTAAVVALYGEWLAPGALEYRDDVAAAHHFPALDGAHACNASVAPFIGDCGFDAAGEMLGFLYPGLRAPVRNAEMPLTEIALPGDGVGLAGNGFLYVPEACRQAGTSCPLHLVLHGCGQAHAQVGEAFMRQSGYLPWAAGNGIVLAFPQVMPTASNPLACWDWWGYTGSDYLTQSGAQLRVLADWVRSLTANGDAEP